MESKFRKSKNRYFKFIIIFFTLIIGFLAYYQLFYKSPRVKNGIANLALVFDKHKHVVTSVRFIPGDSTLVTGSVDSTIKIWKRESGNVIKEIKAPSGVAYMDISEDGNYAVTGDYDSKVRIWSLKDGSIIKELNGHSGTVWTVAFSPDGKMIASSGDDAVINIWNVQTGQLIRSLKGHKRIVWSVKFNRDATKLASGSFDFSLKLWNVKDGALIWNNTEHAETVVDLAFSNKGQLLASTSDDKTIKIWDYENKKLLKTMEVAEHVQAVAFSPDDKRVLTGGRDKPMIGEFLQNIFGNSDFNKGVSARLWDVETGELLQTFTMHSNDVMDVAYSHNGKWIATASADNTVQVWELNK